MARSVENVQGIDRELRRYPWLDMTIAEDTGHDLIVWGSLSESYPFDVRIVFCGLQCVLARRDWKTDTSQTVFRELTDREFNLKYSIEIGQRTFELLAEGVSTPMRFSAKSVRLEVHREPPS